jgi:hypothetical protein
MSFTVVVVTPWPDGAGIDTAASSNATTPNWSRANTRTAKTTNTRTAKTANARTGKMRTAHAGTAETANAAAAKVSATTKVNAATALAALSLRGGRKSGRRQDQRCADRSNFQHRNSPVGFMFYRNVWNIGATRNEFALILVNRKKVIVRSLVRIRCRLRVTSRRKDRSFSPLYPGKRTLAVQNDMSALGHKQTFRNSCDQLVGVDEEQRIKGFAMR